ncbi:MAG: hypothetical protein JW889_16950 [Verrucomicrobia bacterium]|nr:hypothetical protein [Verrucomicrobiota bacterium]
MNVSPVGNPLLHAATLAAHKQSQAHPSVPPEEKSEAARAAAEPQTSQPAPVPQRRTSEELERLADDVLAIFEDSPDSLEQLVATLKRLEGKTAS